MSGLRELPEARAALDAEEYDEDGIPLHVKKKWDEDKKAKLARADVGKDKRGALHVKNDTKEK